MGRSSDPLRAVLLGAAPSGSGSGSKPGSSALTWHSLKSAAPTTRELDPPGHYFPAKLAMSTGLIKIFFSILMLALGGLSFVMKAPLSSLGAGIWVGTVVGVSGFLGICAARRPYVQVYVISFMSVSILSLSASGLLVVLSATSWARDSQNQKPEFVVYDKVTQTELDLFGEILIKSPSILVSGFLVVLGILDILTSLACVALSAREACGTHSSSMGVFTVAHDGHDKKERLYRWLGQQKNIFQVTSTPNGGGKGVSSVSQFVPLSSRGELPAAKKCSPQVSPSIQTREPLLRPVLVKSKTSKSSNLLSSSSGTSSGDSPAVTNENSKKSSKTSKVSKSSSEERNSSSVFFIHPELQKEERVKQTLSNKKQAKRSFESSQHSMYGPYSLPLVSPVEPAYYGPLYQRNQQKIYKYHQKEMLASHFQPSTYYSLPCPKHPRPSYIPHQHPSQIYYHQNMMPSMMNAYPVMAQTMMSSNTLQDRRKVSDIYVTSLLEKEKLKKKDKKKRRKEKRRREIERDRRRNMPLTDEQIDNSYTGLDREIAEGFITLTMEPARSGGKSGVSTSDDQESF